MTIRDIATTESYHAHVYFDAASRERAQELRTVLAAAFPEAAMGRFHERPVGPHPCWSYQLAFAPALFGRVIPWLALNRGDLVVFVHPNTGDALADHRDHAVWLGAKLDLDLDALKE
jgi:aromatic ring-cleaving dioxygenase